MDIRDAEVFIAEKENPDQELVYTPVKNKLLPSLWSKESDKPPSSA